MLAYIIKSIIYLSIMYLPYMLLLKNESFFRFNRIMLLSILVLSLVLPLCDFHFLSVANSPTKGIVEIGLPMIIVEGTVPVQHIAREQTLWEIISGGSWMTFLSRIYIIGMTITLLWKLMQMVILQRQIRRGVLWTETKDGTTIYCHAQDIAPYSWFHQIVISEKDYRDNAEEILRHEMGHILHHHSWDILLLNAVQVLQWANPLVWIMGISLRDVHEYEADDAVLTSGIEARQYQMLLIRKAVGSSSYTFANSFNHSLLTKRVTMMLRKKSSPWMRTKGLYIIPVAVIALSAFATPELNNKVDNLVQQSGSVDKVNQNPANLQNINGENANSVVNDILGDVIESDNDGSEQIENTDTINVNEADDFGPNMLYWIDNVETTYEAAKNLKVEDVSHIEVLRDEETIAALSRGGKHDKKGIIMITTTAAEASKDKDVLEVCEKLPEYPGGIQELMTYLSQAVRYPVAAMNQDVQGRVIVNFIVEKDGSISNVKSQNFHAFNNVKREDVEAGDYERKSSDDETSADNEVYAKAYEATQALIKEAERVVASMPNWTPGMQDGQPVRVRYTIPITFQLQ